MDVQTITVVIAGISVIIGVINSILSSRQAAANDRQMLETRQAQLFAQLHECGDRVMRCEHMETFGLCTVTN